LQLSVLVGLYGPVTNWDPHHYEQFATERLQPGLDLISRIDSDRPGLVVDLGCGTGRLTALLAERWPGAEVVGLDQSAEMLADATPGPRYEQGQIDHWSPSRPVDVIFANASLMWIPDHPRLFPALASHLSPDGVMAVQMPLSWDQPSHRIMREVAVGYGVSTLPAPTLEPADYYRVMANSVSATQVWETTYLHQLQGENPVFSWVSATGMKRFLSRISPDLHDEYRTECARRIAAAYPPGTNRLTIFPFRRLFMMARA
jgi:trans-aconitate 2-methyltransferase